MIWAELEFSLLGVVLALAGVACLLVAIEERLGELVEATRNIHREPGESEGESDT